MFGGMGLVAEVTDAPCSSNSRVSVYWSPGVNVRGAKGPAVTKFVLLAVAVTVVGPRRVGPSDLPRERSWYWSDEPAPVADSPCIVSAAAAAEWLNGVAAVVVPTWSHGVAAEAAAA